MKIIYILIFLLVLISILLFKNNEHYKSNCIITQELYGGINDRLFQMFIYIEYARLLNKRLRLTWIIHDECIDEFDKLFQPIPNVEIINHYDDLELSKDEIYNNADLYNTIMQKFADNSNKDDNVIKNYYKLLKPISTIQNNIDQYKEKLQYTYIACHIRRTDISLIIPDNEQPPSDKDYMDFIDRYDPKLKIYIATDNRDTQNIYLDKYRDRLVIKLIIPSDNLRQTSGQDTITDIFICAGAKYFMGHPFSYMTKTINYLRD